MVATTEDIKRIRRQVIFSVAAIEAAVDAGKASVEDAVSALFQAKAILMEAVPCELRWLIEWTTRESSAAPSALSETTVSSKSP